MACGISIGSADPIAIYVNKTSESWFNISSPNAQTELPTFIKGTESGIGYVIRNLATGKEHRVRTWVEGKKKYFDYFPTESGDLNGIQGSSFKSLPNYRELRYPKTTNLMQIENNGFLWANTDESDSSAVRSGGLLSYVLGLQKPITLRTSKQLLVTAPVLSGKTYDVDLQPELDETTDPPTSIGQAFFILTGTESYTLSTTLSDKAQGLAVTVGQFTYGPGTLARGIHEVITALKAARYIDFNTVEAPPIDD